MNEQTLIAFIGGGNMAASLIGGLITNGHAPRSILVSEPSPETAAALAGRFGIKLCASNADAAGQAEVVVLAVKPQVMRDVAVDLAASLGGQKPLFVSIAAGIREQALREWLGGDVWLIRAMPNTPAMIQSGATVLHAGPGINPRQRNLAESIMRAVGLIQWVEDEAKMDIVTALSGSGPAYFFLVMEILEQAAVELGLSPDSARLLTLQTALGASRLALESPESTAILRQKVTSPGGTTERAIGILEQGGIRKLFAEALKGAKIRSEELSDIMGGRHE
ncbi:MAG: pyrroline-5-carboxylate reductase [Gammaproteobacteria bacterium RIFOXYA12_FULL_61_12]|nr:MAG: pyrroline-5-carboxylate reductase [Gammaproteobacteria bacterium RIFOXYD12_FULL_61_37]OGT94533.1 MAG: pyrroline-5-carboxylate reductase [Gammaproteobacteria bacterium RIFOXYA12_FULL_61_12]